jgi:predicted O-methyltransferase YrrM
MIARSSQPFVFVHIPRTGGTSIEMALTQHLLGKSLEALSDAEMDEWRLPGPGRVHQHGKLADYPRAGGPAFAFVRNPWDWAVSEVAYFMKHGHPLFAGRSWKDGLMLLAEGAGTVIWGHDFLPQTASLCGENGHPGVTWAGRFEFLQEHFSEICTWLNLPALRLGRQETTREGRPHYRELYDDESREAIGQRYAADATVFGYEFDGLRADESRKLLATPEIQRRWLGWLEQCGLSPLGWRTAEPSAGAELASHGKYEGLKKWGWYLDDAARWAWFFRTETPVKALEIGAFDGVSAGMMLDLLFPHVASEVHAVDPYLPDPTTPQVNAGVRQVFEDNRLTGGHADQIKLYEGISGEVLAWMLAGDGFWESFDFIYVDGSHAAKDVFIDAALSWNLLKPGGVIGFDDYEWGNPAFPHKRPQLAIRAFEDVFGDRIALVFGGYRRFYRKLRG